MSVNSLRQVSSQDGTWVRWFRSNCHGGLLFRYRRLLCRPFIALTRRQAAPGGGWTKWSWRSSPTLTILYLSLLTSRTKKGRLFTLSNTGFGTRHPHVHLRCGHIQSLSYDFTSSLPALPGSICREQGGIAPLAHTRAHKAKHTQTSLVSFTPRQGMMLRVTSGEGQWAECGYTNGLWDLKATSNWECFFYLN